MEEASQRAVTQCHKKTVAALTGNDNVAEAMKQMHQKTISYSSRADVLSNLQDLFSFLLPQASGQRHLVDGAGLHGIKAIIQAFDAL